MTSSNGFRYISLFRFQCISFNLFYSFCVSNKSSSNYDSSDEEEDTSVSKRVTSKIGLNPTSPHEEQKAALLWALLASYLPEGTNYNFNAYSVQM